LLDDRQPGATAAGMGHLVCMDDDPAELALSAWSLARWRTLTPRMPERCAWRGCGTLWLAETRAGDGPGRKTAAAGRISGLQRDADPTADRSENRCCVPACRAGCGCPAMVSSTRLNVARWFIADAGDNLTCLSEGAREIAEPAVTLTSGKRLRAPAIVVACGLGANGLLGENWLRPKKASWRSPTATARYSIISWSNWATAPAPTAAAPRWRLTCSRAPPDSC
jgi:glycine/D-amino acid oxidase-like deaminating enzyme